MLCLDVSKLIRLFFLTVWTRRVRERQKKTTVSHIYYSQWKHIHTDTCPFLWSIVFPMVQLLYSRIGTHLNSRCFSSILQFNEMPDSALACEFACFGASNTFVFTPYDMQFWSGETLIYFTWWFTLFWSYFGPIHAQQFRVFSISYRLTCTQQHMCFISSDEQKISRETLWTLRIFIFK